MPLKQHIIGKFKQATFGFRWRLNAVLGGFLVLIVVINVVANMVTQRQMLEGRLDTRITEISGLLTEITGSYLFNQRLDELEIIFEDLYAQDDVENLVVIDRDGLMLVDGKLRADDYLLGQVDDHILGEVLSRQAFIRHRHGTSEHIGIPIRFNREIQAVVRLDLSRKAYQQELDTVVENNVVLGLIFIAVSLAVCNLLAEHLTRPLQALIRFTNRVADGHLDGKADDQSNDEFGLLGDAFNKMVSQLSVTLDEVHKLAYRDKLTDLRNRAWFNNYVARFFEEAGPEQKAQTALFLLDLDRFKFINDTYGHHVGDQLLSAVAMRLRHVVNNQHSVCLEEDDDFNNRAFRPSIARLGGDEFILFLPHMRNSHDIHAIAQKIIEIFRKPVWIEDVEHSVTVSLGIATFDQQADSFEDLFKMADSAMYQAKARGKNNYQFFDKSLAEEAAERLLIEKDLREAITDKQFEAFFQPQVHVESGMVVGGEALLRWRHPKRGLLAPAAFLSVAIEANLMVDIGRCLFETAISRASQWTNADGDPVKLSLNATATELEQPDFASFLLDLMRRYDMNPSRLELEVTEETLMLNEAMVEAQISELKEYGVSIAVDDFGVGYSNLARLRKLRFDTLKIDRGLMYGLGSDEEAESLVRSILYMADALNLRVVAEGVETLDQLDFLTAERCMLIQGYLFAEPMDQALFEQMIGGAMALKALADDHRGQEIKGCSAA